MAALRLLADLEAALRSLGVRWFVFGAQAVVVHGRPRMTADVDVTVELGDVSLDTLLAELNAHGFEPAFELDDEFVHATRVVPLRHVASEMPLDLVLAGPGVEERFLDGAVGVQLGATTVPVIAPEHLIVTKLLAGRPKDLEDVRGVLEAATKLDVTEIEGILASLEEALGQADLLPRWNALRDERSR